MIFGGYPPSGGSFAHFTTKAWLLITKHHPAGLLPVGLFEKDTFCHDDFSFRGQLMRKTGFGKNTWQITNEKTFSGT